MMLKKYSYQKTDIIIKGYKICDHLGGGQYGQVYSAKTVSFDKEYAYKIAIKIVNLLAFK